MTRRALSIALLLASTLCSRGSYAQAAPSPEALQEAAERFDRGLHLFNNGDNAGALAEFRRAYQIAPNVLVLFNVGLVYAQMGSAVEATDALDQVLADPGRMSPERLAIARRTRDEQAARIAEINVSTNVDGSTVELDSIEVGTTPLAKPLRVTSGDRTIGAYAPGYAPKRIRVSIASREKQSHRLELVPMQGHLAHLAIKTHLPGAALFADDQRIGTTPVSVSISLEPGAHHVELRRPGYTTARTDITLGDGATGEVLLEPVEDPTELAGIGGRLALQIDEPDASVVVDGQSRGAYVLPLRLAPGPHRVLVLTPNFEPFERDVTVESNTTTSVHVALLATPEFRAKFAAHARSRRVWSIVTAAAGLAVAGGGVGVLAYDGKVRQNANATLAALPDVRHSGTFCDPSNANSAVCGFVGEAQTNLSNAQTLDAIAWSAVGVGAAAVVVGVVLLATSDSPHAYDVPLSPKAGDVKPSAGGFTLPTVWTARGGGGLGLAGSF